jgi:SM-20-related protein
MDYVNKLDTEALHREYADTGAVIIPNLLREDVAEAAFTSLQSAVPWEFHVRQMHAQGVGIVDPVQFAEMTPRQIKRMVPKIAQLKDNDFTFAYCRYTIPTKLEQAAPDTRILSEIYRYFNSPEYLALMAKITGDDSGKEVSTWASRYDRNHHLSIHMDESPGQGRIAAHVLGLSKDWKKEWGGNFAFCNKQGKPVKLVPPAFNQLVLFKVPRLHLVTQVKPYAMESRYSLFGWYKSKQQYFME